MYNSYNPILNNIGMYPGMGMNGMMSNMGLPEMMFGGGGDVIIIF